MTRELIVAPERRGAFASIRDAVDAAPAGAVVLVAPGVYREALAFVDADIRLAAAETSAPVELDARGLGLPALAVRGGRVSVTGFTLTGGELPAVHAERATLSVTDCVASSQFGAVVDVRDRSMVELRRTRISGGQFGVVFDDAGGSMTDCEVGDIADDGVIVRLGADPRIRTTTISRCRRRGVYVYQFGRPVLEECEISATGDAGIVVVHQSAPVIRRCHVHDTGGVGISLGRGCGGEVSACRLENTGSPAVEVAEGADTRVETGGPAAGPA
ncbi:right-handed parallel beta-helix repeat-containing protein, partial [Frankia sp. AiPs1]|uniref:right-handed parallel beta-helix repeat-containing protein n=1 Tax=Frankia sp. AiPs1 TaxID=573493 RepID=UPI002044366B